MRRKRRWLIGGAVALMAVAAAVWGAAVWRDLRGSRADLVRARTTLQALGGDPASLRTPAGRAKTQRALDQALGNVKRADQRLRHSVPLTLTRAVPGLASQ